VNLGALDPGTVVDAFVVEEQVHAGGMAVLYRVSAPDAAFPLIMKVPRLGPGEPASSVISFEIEQMVLAALRGPHVPRFVTSREDAERPYIVMEYVQGRSLDEWVERAPLPAEEVARLGAAVATALHALHLQDAIHLDVKPSNVMIRPGGEAVLIDFGLAHHGHYPDLLAEEVRRPVGSAPYIAPEQVLGVRCDPRSDIFALGAVLYELATGELPFGAPSSQATLRRRLWRDPVPPRAIARDVPEWLQHVILRCLEVDAGVRYPTAAQVAFDLSHPAEVTAGERGLRTRRAGPWQVLKKWVKAIGFEPAPCPQPSVYIAGASIVLAAVATAHSDAAQAEAIREAVGRVVAAGGHSRLACVTVVPPSSDLGGSAPHDTATSQRLRHRVLLRHWAEPLKLPGTQISFHVLEANNPAAALLEYARANAVDHIVIGAPPHDVRLHGMLGAVAPRVAPDAAPEPLQLLRRLGTVSMKVAAEAPCTVTLVRAAAAGA
jgi:nucleotide-binding universal stress UspA family protein/predicted Ser/Thr protein kinase